MTHLQTTKVAPGTPLSPHLHWPFWNPPWAASLGEMEAERPGTRRHWDLLQALAERHLGDGSWPKLVEKPMNHAMSVAQSNYKTQIQLDSTNTQKKKKKQKKYKEPDGRCPAHWQTIEHSLLGAKIMQYIFAMSCYALRDWHKQIMAGFAGSTKSTGKHVTQTLTIDENDWTCMKMP